MPKVNDEQLREQFEAQRLPSYSQEVRDRLFEVDNLGQYTNHSMNSEWIGWKDGYAARDGEVQALREALGRLLIATDQIERYDDTTDLIAASDRALW